MVAFSGPRLSPGSRKARLHLHVFDFRSAAQKGNDKKTNGRSLNRSLLIAYAGTDLVVGVFFGAIALYLVYPQPMPALVARGINEIVFPLGCSIVIYAADVFGRRAE